MVAVPDLAAGASWFSGKVRPRGRCESRPGRPSCPIVTPFRSRDFGVGDLFPEKSIRSFSKKPFLPRCSSPDSTPPRASVRGYPFPSPSSFLGDHWLQRFQGHPGTYVMALAPQFGPGKRRVDVPWGSRGSRLLASITQPCRASDHGRERTASEGAGYGLRCSKPGPGLQKITRDEVQRFRGLGGNRAMAIAFHFRSASFRRFRTHRARASFRSDVQEGCNVFKPSGPHMEMGQDQCQLPGVDPTKPHYAPRRRPQADTCRECPSFPSTRSHIHPQQISEDTHE